MIILAPATPATRDLLDEIQRLGDEQRLKTALQRLRFGAVSLGDLEDWWRERGFDLARSRGLVR